MRALRRSDFDWWIVLDDVDDPADLVGLWPGGARGRTLWLTRRRGRDMEGEGRHVVMVEGFTRREGQRYLRGRLGPAVEAGEMVSNTFDEVDGLVRDLGGTPPPSLWPPACCGRIATPAPATATCSPTDWTGWKACSPPSRPRRGTSAAGCSVGHFPDRAEQWDPTRLASWAALMIAVLNPAGVPAKIMTTEAVRRFWLARARNAPDWSGSTTSRAPRGRWSRTA